MSICAPLPDSQRLGCCPEWLVPGGASPPLSLPEAGLCVSPLASWGHPLEETMASKLCNFSDSAYDLNALIVVFKTGTAHVKVKGKIYSTNVEFNFS